jgi:hypothetical protein
MIESVIIEDPVCKLRNSAAQARDVLEVPFAAANSKSRIPASPLKSTP